MKVDVFIPSSYRSQRLKQTIDSIRSTTPEVDILVICPRDDFDSIELAGENVYVFTDRINQSFPHRIKKLYGLSDADWFLTGADDIIFHEGWLDEAKKYMDYSHVISFQDLCNPHLPGTNFLIRRKYIEEFGATIDEKPGEIFWTGYTHNYCDNEIVFVATWRRAFYQCDGIIEHFHPTIQKASWDRMYQIAKDAEFEDARKFHERIGIWESSHS